MHYPFGFNFVLSQPNSETRFHVRYIVHQRIVVGTSHCHTYRPLVSIFFHDDYTRYLIHLYENSEAFHAANTLCTERDSVLPIGSGKW